MAARQRQTYGEEVANVLTHGAGMLFGMTAIIVLMMAAIRSGNPWAIGSFAVYAVCMTLSYVTSTFYHASTHARQKRLLRRFDHGAIYLHIAGTYTPFTLLALRQEGYWGWSLFAVIWIAAVIGAWLSFRKMRKKDHLKTVCYLAMGWVVIIAFKPLLHVFRETGSMNVLYWLIGGGLFYTVGCLFLLCRSAALLPLSPLRTVRATFRIQLDNSKFNLIKLNRLIIQSFDDLFPIKFFLHARRRELLSFRFSK